MMKFNVEQIKRTTRVQKSVTVTGAQRSAASPTFVLAKNAKAKIRKVHSGGWILVGNEAA